MGYVAVGWGAGSFLEMGELNNCPIPYGWAFKIGIGVMTGFGGLIAAAGSTTKFGSDGQVRAFVYSVYVSVISLWFLLVTHGFSFFSRGAACLIRQ